jgi:hypothetical protein
MRALIGERGAVTFTVAQGRRRAKVLVESPGQLQPPQIP